MRLLDDHRTMLTAHYMVFAASAVLQFSPSTILFGGLLLTVSIILLYDRRGRAEGTVYASHYRWLIRTFWLGSGVYLPVMMVAACVIIFTMMDFSSILSAAQSGSMDVEGMTRALISVNGGRPVGLLITLSVAFIMWWIWRSWRGYAFLKEGRAVEKADSWL